MKLVMKNQIVETFGYHFCKHIVYIENITALNNKIVDWNWQILLKDHSGLLRNVLRGTRL